MNRPRIHLIGPAGSCRKFMAEVEAPTAAQFLDLVQSHVGASFAVTGDAKIIDAEENDGKGGRRDDRRRANDIEGALAASDVAAIVSIRGGAWVTRILNQIDFEVLSKRKSPVAIYGFSELTSLINIAGRSSLARAIHDMGPAFLTYGVSRRISGGKVGEMHTTAREKTLARVAQEFAAFWKDVVSMLEGRGTNRRAVARCVRGKIPNQAEITCVGGNLVVLCSLLGTRFQPAVQPKHRWLLLEEINEKPERIDRWLANLTLAGFWEDCEGLLLGDFHQNESDLSDAVEALLEFHLPSNRCIPILKCPTIGHTWPMSPLPLHVPVTLARETQDAWSLSWPGSTLQVV